MSYAKNKDGWFCNEHPDVDGLPVKIVLLQPQCAVHNGALIRQLDGGEWYISASTEAAPSWKQIAAGHVVAGPFPHLDAAKAAYLVLYGR